MQSIWTGLPAQLSDWKWLGHLPSHACPPVFFYYFSFINYVIYLSYDPIYVGIVPLSFYNSLFVKRILYLENNVDSFLNMLDFLQSFF